MLNVASKKSISFRLVFTSVKSYLLNVLLPFFKVHLFLKIIRPLSLYKPVSFVFILIANVANMYFPTGLQISAHRNICSADIQNGGKSTECSRLEQRCVIKFLVTEK